MSALVSGRDIPVGSVDKRANGWWGVLTLIATEGALFGFLLFAYYYLAIQHGRDWLPDEMPKFRLSLPDTILLIASSFVAWRGERGVRHGGSPRVAALWLLGAAIMGAVFAFVQTLEWASKSFTLSTSAYGSLYYTITGFHLAHVVVGVAALLALSLWTALGYFDRERNAPVSIGALYWHFVDAVWLAVFFTIYVTPYLGLG